MTQAVALAQQASTGVSQGFKNRIINGAMVIDQRNAGASVTPDNTYTLDRWFYGSTQNSKVTIQQNAGSVTPPVGFSNYLGVTSSSAYSITSSDIFYVRQPIEGFNTADLMFGTANAKTVTLSFWVYSSLTGTFGGSLRNSASSRSYPYSYTISSANTWEYKTITIPGDTTGTWVGATNGIGMLVHFGLGVGSTYSGTAGAWAGANYLSATGATSVVGTNGATFYITGVQLEVGSTATSFDTRSIGQELMLCQRYYKRISRVDSSGGDNGIINLADWNGTDAYSGNIISPSMRSAPSLSYSALSDFAYYEAGSIKTPTGITIVGSGPNHAEISVGWSGGLTAGRAGWMRINGSSGWIAFSSEL
jgi:hypothetical protein